MKLSISREERALMVWHLGMDASSCEKMESVVDSGNREEAYRLRDKLDFVLGMREILGWDDSVDQEQFEVVIDDSVVMTWLVDIRSEYEINVGSLVCNRARQEAGEADHYYGDGQTASIELTDEYIARDRKKALLADDLVEKIREQRLAVA